MAPELRIGDAEREQASAALAEHFAQGRLDDEEYAERLDAAWSARTRSDLAQLFWDLPATTPPRHRPAPASSSGARGPRWRVPLLVLAVGLLLLALVTHVPLVILVVVLVVGVLVARGRSRG